MPIYTFQHPETEEVVEVVQRMKETHEHIDDDGVQWRRVFTVPQANADVNIDPFNARAFNDKNRLSNASFGDLQKQSEDASRLRADKNSGVDPVKKKYFKDWSAKREGKKHPQDK
jgi:hypothetical protein